MKHKFIALFLLLLIGFIASYLLLNRGKEVEVYAIDMMYACGDCRTYRIFEQENGRQFYAKDSFSVEQDKVLISKADQVRKLDFPADPNSLLGHEFHLKFTHHETQRRFEDDENSVIYPVCSVFYFQGTLMNRRWWLAESEPFLIVNHYKIIPIEGCLRRNH